MILKRLWVLLPLLLALDIITKKIALVSIPPMEWGGSYPFGGIGIFSNGISCSLNLAFNTGAAWGIFQGHSQLLFIVRSVVIAFLIGYLIKRREKKLPLWLIAVGAVGNAIDFCIYGHVVDFIHLNFWGHTFPIFNLADSFITIGAVWLFLTPRKHAAQSLRS